jgi:hypothetical protein
VTEQGWCRARAQRAAGFEKPPGPTGEEVAARTRAGRSADG